MDLREYEYAKFELAEVLRSLGELSKDAPGTAQDRLRELFARLAEDRFNLVVVGRFGRGKSSLMNAILGTNRLPTGILPLTSVITTVVFGSTEKVVIHYEGSRLSTDIELDALPEYITQQRNPGNARRVKTAEVQLPAEILRRGFHFIDTPGLGSAIAENTRTTEAFLPEADALLLVTSYESPLSVEELSILRSASWYARRVFVILNKQDTVTPAECEEGLRYVREQLAHALGPRAPEVFSVSARTGLEAKRLRDDAALAQSGLPALEAELVRFLLEEKREAFLSSFCEHVLDVGDQLPRSEEGARIVQRVQALARRVIQESAAVPPTSDVPVAGPVDIGTLHRLQPCEVCEHVREVAFDFLCHYQYELSVSQDAQRRHAEMGGLCAGHTRQFAALAAPRGVCIGYPALLDHLSSRLKTAAAAMGDSGSRPFMRARLLPGTQSCILCRLCATAQAETIAGIAERFARDAQGALNSLSGICMAHLPDLVHALRAREDAQDLLVREAAILERLSEDMRRYATKFDAIRRQLASDEETEAAERALFLMAGLPNVQLVDDVG